MSAAGQRHGSLIVISGPPHSGKTSLVCQLLHRLHAQGWRTAGMLAEGHWHNGQRSGFTLVDLSDGRRTPLAERVASAAEAVPYRFLPEGLAAGRRALSPARCAQAELVVVDEVGQLEVRDQGWAPLLPALLSRSQQLQLWVVQSAWLPEVCRKWKLMPRLTVDCTACNSPTQLTAIVEEIRSHGSAPP